eukprot:scaffold69069_cov17-Tisochrysis_lutea.AAC.3
MHVKCGQSGGDEEVETWHHGSSTLIGKCGNVRHVIKVPAYKEKCSIERYGVIAKHMKESAALKEMASWQQHTKGLLQNVKSVLQGLV